MLKHLTRTGATALLLTLLATHAQAALIDLSERDWLAPGDGALTFDATTGLEWLDLTLTRGNSIVDTEAESFFVGNGGDFRWATNAEIVGLLNHLSWVNFPLSSAAAGLDNPAPPLVSETSQLIGLLGATLDNAGEFRAHGVSRGSPHPTLPGQFGLGFVRILFDGQTGNPLRLESGNPLGNCCFLETSPSPVVGSWLVRSAVPEPAALTLVVLGITASLRRGRGTRASVTRS